MRESESPILQIALGSDDAVRRNETEFTGMVTHLARYVVRYRSDLSDTTSSPGTN